MNGGMAVRQIEVRTQRAEGWKDKAPVEGSLRQRTNDSLQTTNCERFHQQLFSAAEPHLLEEKWLLQSPRLGSSKE